MFVQTCTCLASSNESTYSEIEKQGAFDIDSSFLLGHALSSGSSIKSKHTSSKKPIYGKASDYTKKQKTIKRSIAFDNTIKSMTASAVAAACTIASAGLLFTTVGLTAVQVARDKKSQSKSTYYIKTQYGHKKMPGVYHKYVTEWYLDSKYKVYLTKTTYYDANL